MLTSPLRAPKLRVMATTQPAPAYSWTGEFAPSIRHSARDEAERDEEFALLHPGRCSVDGCGEEADPLYQLEDGECLCSRCAASLALAVVDGVVELQVQS